MLGDLEEAQDAVQHTFLAAYDGLLRSEEPVHLKAWLFTIARNRCYSILRRRREQPTGEVSDAYTEGLAAQVQRRQDLRDLIVDMRQLPDDQRAALVLAELDALSHQEIAEVLGVPRDKVKALVFQARESLIASRTARETDCAEIREQLATLHGAGLRRGTLKRHLRECTACREFRKQVERQKRQLAVLLPVGPGIAFKELVLGGTVAGGTIGAISGGGLLASSIFKGGLVKLLVGAALAGVGTAGTLVVANQVHLPKHHPRAAARKLATRPAIARRAHTPAAHHASRQVAAQAVGTYTPRSIPVTLRHARHHGVRRLFAELHVARTAGPLHRWQHHLGDRRHHLHRWHHRHRVALVMMAIARPTRGAGLHHPRVKWQHAHKAGHDLYATWHHAAARWHRGLAMGHHGRAAWHRARVRFHRDLAGREQHRHTPQHLHRAHRGKAR
jgi:RNA polymerase sigma factor (sigma-70 family)